jgi:tetratricopeptide (TPR) repeat protein
MGRTDEALAEGRMALELDPASVSIRRGMGWLEYYARRPALALEHLRKAVEMNPTAEENHRLLGLAYLSMGLLDPAEAAFREAIATSDSPALSTAGLGRVAARRGEPDQARAVLQRLQDWTRDRYVNPAAFAMVHIELGEIDEAFAWLERAYQDRRGWLAYLKVEPDFDPLRADPRFAQFLGRMRLA